jgi:hypothetical protein
MAFSSRPRKPQSEIPCKYFAQNRCNKEKCEFGHFLSQEPSAKCQQLEKSGPKKGRISQPDDILMPDDPEDWANCGVALDAFKKNKEIKILTQKTVAQLPNFKKTAVLLLNGKYYVYGKIAGGEFGVHEFTVNAESAVVPANQSAELTANVVCASNAPIIDKVAELEHKNRVLEANVEALKLMMISSQPDQNEAQKRLDEISAPLITAIPSANVFSEDLTSKSLESASNAVTGFLAKLAKDREARRQMLGN